MHVRKRTRTSALNQLDITAAISKSSCSRRRRLPIPSLHGACSIAAVLVGDCLGEIRSLRRESIVVAGADLGGIKREL